MLSAIARFVALTVVVVPLTVRSPPTTKPLVVSSELNTTSDPVPRPKLVREVETLETSDRLLALIRAPPAEA